MFPQYPGPYISDGDGDVPPEYGGTIACKRAAFTKTSTTGATAFTLPPGATIVFMQIVIDTVFSGGTTTISVGHPGSATYYLNGASAIGTAGPVYSTSWSTVGKWNTKLSAPEPITITVGASNTAGAGWLIVYYTME